MRRLGSIGLGLVLAAGLVSAAEVPPLMNFQGRLTDQAGVPLPDGNVTLRFRVYDTDAGNNGLPCGDPGASCRWEELQTVTLRAGVYSVLLGSVNPLQPWVFSSPETYLGVQVGTAAELSPRNRIAAVPYALGAPTSWPVDDGEHYSARAGYAIVPGGPFEGRIDWLQCAAFNFQSGCGGTREDPSFYAFSDQWEWTYRVSPNTYAIEKNWDFTSELGEFHRYYAFFLNTKTGNASFAFMPRFGSPRALRWGYDGSRGEQDNRLGVNISSSLPGATLEVKTVLDGPVINTIPSIQSNVTIQPQNADSVSQLFSGLDVNMTSVHQLPGAAVGSLAGLDVSLVATGNGDAGQTTESLFGSRFVMGPHGRVESASGYGAFYQFDLTGQDYTTNFLSHIFIKKPAGPPGPGTVIGQLHGIFIEDLGGYSGFGDALTIEAQTTAGRGDQGNLTLQGGGWDDGHHRIGSTHLWQEAAGRLRVSVGAPGSASAGNAVVTGSGSATHGPAAWAASGTSCDTACGSMGLACEDAWSLAPKSAAGCADAAAARVCFCR